MALTLVRQAVVSSAVGAADIITETIDARMAFLRPFQNISDWVRTGVTIGGYAAGYMREGSSSGEYLKMAAIAYEPLMLRSVYNALAKGKLFGEDLIPLPDDIAAADLEAQRRGGGAPPRVSATPPLVTVPRGGFPGVTPRKRVGFPEDEYAYGQDEYGQVYDPTYPGGPGGWIYAGPGGTGPLQAPALAPGFGYRDFTPS